MSARARAPAAVTACAACQYVAGATAAAAAVEARAHVAAFRMADSKPGTGDPVAALLNAPVDLLRLVTDRLSLHDDAFGAPPRAER
jgi:hypothetical protein